MLYGCIDLSRNSRSRNQTYGCLGARGQGRSRQWPSGDTKVLFKLLQTFHTLFGRGSMTIYKALGMYWIICLKRRIFLLIVLQFKDWHFAASWRKLINETNKVWKTAQRSCSKFSSWSIPPGAGAADMSRWMQERRNKLTFWALAWSESDSLHTEKPLLYLKTVIKVKAMIYHI